ncbi:MAG: class I SAM-dependent methyltransferase [Anaerolineae bacterium]
MPQLPDAHDNMSLAWASYEMAQTTLEVFGPAVDVSRQRVLDVGCGLGGKTVYYAEQGACSVVGLDVSEERARVALALAGRHPAGVKVRIVVGDAARLPFRADLFDCVISTDTWEHLNAPILALGECARVVQPGGTVLISTLPYFSPWGAHAWNWLPLPWIQAILPRHGLFSLVSWIEQRRRINTRLPSAVRLDWMRPNDPAHARGLTVAALERGLSVSGMRTARFTVVPVGASYGSIMTRLTQVLIRLPLLREVLAGLVIVVMRKPLPEE